MKGGDMGEIGEGGSRRGEEERDSEGEKGRRDGRRRKGREGLRKGRGRVGEGWAMQ